MRAGSVFNDLGQPASSNLSSASPAPFCCLSKQPTQQIYDNDSVLNFFNGR